MNNSGPFAPMASPTRPQGRDWILVKTDRMSRPDGKAAVGYDGDFVCPSNDHARLYNDGEKDNMILPRGYEWQEYWGSQLWLTHTRLMLSQSDRRQSMMVPPCPCCKSNNHHTWYVENCPGLNPSPRLNRRALLQELASQPGPHTHRVMIEIQTG